MTSSTLQRFRSAPANTKKMPAGIPYIIANEAAERYSFYGMRGILVVFMTTYLVNAQGQSAPMSETEAKQWFHTFVSAAYLFPIMGAVLADAFWGKYKTILFLSMVYCAGHLALALDESRTGLLLGLALIAIGSGGIKPCVSAHVGDQFGSANQHLLPRVFNWFYFAINIGALTSILFAEPLLHRYGAGVAFGIPGVLMAMATFVFWLGRNRFVHIPPGGKTFIRDLLSKQGLLALAKLSIIYVFIAMFWSLFDQQGSAWVLQAQKMDKHFIIDWQPSQMQWLNPALVLILIPLFNFGIYPLLERLVRVTPLRKIAAGFFMAGLAFACSAWLQTRIDAGETVNIVWQLGGYVLITIAEVLISITALEFSYTQAPKTMKSVIMGVFLLSVSIGNLFTAAVNYVIQNDDGTSQLTGADYYWFFTAAMFITAVLFVPVALAYKEESHMQSATP